MVGVGIWRGTGALARLNMKGTRLGKQTAVWLLKVTGHGLLILCEWGTV